MKMTKEVEAIFDIIGYHIAACTENLNGYRTKRSVALDGLGSDCSDDEYAKFKEDYHTFCSLVDSFTEQLYALESLKRAIERECGIYAPVPDDEGVVSDD